MGSRLYANVFIQGVRILLAISPSLVHLIDLILSSFISVQLIDCRCADPAYYPFHMDLFPDRMGGLERTNRRSSTST